MKLSTFLFALFITSFIGIAQPNSWQQTDFPQQYEGYVTTLHVSPNGTIFAGTNNEGWLRSTNDGGSWEQVQNAQQGEPKLIVTTSSGEVFATINYQLHRSADNGASWSPIGLPEWRYWILGLVINSNDDLFVGAVGLGAYRSTDHGNSWVAINGGLPREHLVFGLAVSPVGAPQTLYLSHGTGPYSFYRSTDNGNSWRLSPLSTTNPNLFVHSNGFVFRDGNTGLLRSTDNGNSWQSVSASVGIAPMLSMPNGAIWYASGSQILNSADYGFSWVNVATLNTSTIVTMARSQSGSVFLGTYWNGVFSTTDNGLIWQQTNNGFPNATSQVTTITGRPGGVVFAGTTHFGNFLSTNSGDTWTRNYPGNQDISRLAAHPGGTVFAASTLPLLYGPTLRLSTDRGNHWQIVPSGSTYIYASDVTIDNSGIIYSCGELSGVQRSTDIGMTWTWLPCPGTAYPRMHVTSQGTIVALTPYRYSSYPVIDYYYTRTSTDGGQSWIPSSPGGERTMPQDYGSTSDGYLFAATDLGIYRSSDSGQTWVSANSGMPANDVRVLASNSINEMYAGTNAHGVFRSANHGDSWEPFNTGLTDTVITSLYCDSDGYLFAGTYSKGIFKTAQRTTSVNNQTDSHPVAFALRQNYPNPFNPSTTIKYELPRASHVTLTVYDVLGREVATLVNGVEQPGSKSVEFNAGNMASGVYFYRIQAGDYVLTKKLLLLLR